METWWNTFAVVVGGLTALMAVGSAAIRWGYRGRTKLTRMVPALDAALIACALFSAGVSVVIYFHGDPQSVFAGMATLVLFMVLGLISIVLIGHVLPDRSSSSPPDEAID